MPAAFYENGAYMKQISIALIIAAHFALAGTVFAQQPLSSHDQAVLDLIKLTKADQQMMTATENIADAMANSNPMLAQFRDVLVEWTRKYMTWNEMLPHVVKLYKETFTESEIRELITFYQTPVGQKVLAKMPELTQKGFLIGNSIGQAHSAELRQMIEAKAKQMEESARKKP